MGPVVAASGGTPAKEVEEEAVEASAPAPATTMLATEEPAWSKAFPAVSTAGV